MPQQAGMVEAIKNPGLEMDEERICKASLNTSHETMAK